MLLVWKPRLMLQSLSNSVVVRPEECLMVHLYKQEVTIGVQTFWTMVLGQCVEVEAYVCESHLPLVGPPFFLDSSAVTHHQEPPAPLSKYTSKISDMGQVPRGRCLDSPTCSGMIPASWRHRAWRRVWGNPSNSQPWNTRPSRTSQQNHTEQFYYWYW